MLIAVVDLPWVWMVTSSPHAFWAEACPAWTHMQEISASRARTTLPGIAEFIVLTVPWPRFAMVGYRGVIERTFSTAPPSLWRYVRCRSVM